MRAEERISQLERELALDRAKNAALQAEHASLQADYVQPRQQLEQVLSRLKEVEGQVASAKPMGSRPSSALPTG